MAAHGTSVTAVRGVSFWYPGARAAEPALAGLDVTIRQGEFVVLCGPSGSGKSTLLRLLLGLVPRFSGGQLAGEVEVLGRDPTVVSPRDLAAAGVGLLFQNPVEGFVAERVADEVAFGPENLGVAPADVETRIAEGLAAVGLSGYERRSLRDLSTGQQQRVAFAAALALRPHLLLLDEPTAHLDERAAAAVLALVARVHRERGVTVLLGEHRLGLAAPLAGRVLVLANGRLIADGPPRDVFADASLADRGVPVPRATQAAVRLDASTEVWRANLASPIWGGPAGTSWKHLGAVAPLPLTAVELAERILGDGAAAAGRGASAFSPEHARVPPLPGARVQGCDPSPAVGEGGTDALHHTPPPDAAGDRPVLVFDGVSFMYPRATAPAVAGVSFTVRQGEVTALVGPSGAGKSTLTRLALGLLKPGSGRVELGGVPTQRAPVSVLAQVGGLVLQNPLYQLLAERVDDELRLGLRDLPAEEAAARVERLLATFSLRDLRARHPLLLSEGQRRRVALAAVLVRQPRVLVLDEPTLGQDERQRSALVALVRQVAATGGAILAISHDAEFVNDACDRVLVLREGRLVADLPMHLSYEEPGQLAEAGAPLADVPATARLLSRRGRPTRARHVTDLVAALR